ncbi:ATP-binding protein [Streptomyces ochraceiscleroticus]|uniref:ATP-binding protein n=1 Tax=Streptomyces ochraceiscleroticus TaxID=47761 RepID=A0ABW1MLX8_9ACTN|nr:NB-ARC domain-containing protein [Streptomyces ochraceiscleroticus]
MRRQQAVGNLPGEKGELIGRRSELAQISRSIGATRLVTLTGAGGVGKTRLALGAAAEAQPSFRDGAWWVELSPLRDDAMLAHTIAETLPLADQTTRPMIEVVAEYLAGRELLLVLDTCEHLADECALVAEALLAAAPGLRILVTSRRPLGMDAERLLTVAPLPVPDGEATGNAAGGADAVALLAARAAEAVPGFTVTDANRSDLVRLCRRLDGLPLAIELAAARLREMSVAELTDRLEDRFAVLGTTDEVVRGAEPPWHQALRTAIGWSHELCSPAERLAWARLSVFAGSFDAEAARRVCADERLPEGAIPGLLDALVDKSIVTWVPTGGGERYRMLDTIREYGAHWLRGLGEEDTVHCRHRDYYQALADRAEAVWMGPEQIAWYERMVTEYANLRAALEFCLAEQDGHSALELGGTLWFFWTSCGFAKEGLHYLDRALAKDPIPGPHQGKALWAGGHVAVILGDTETSLRLAAAFREAMAQEADESAGFVAAFLEGISYSLRGELTRAAEALDTAPRTRPGTGTYDPAWFSVKATRGFVHVYLGQFADAVAVGNDLSAEGTRRGETWARAWGDYVLALAALGLGRTEEAAAHARTALDGKRRFRNGVGIAMAVDVLACATVAAGRAEQAARLLGVADQTWHTLGIPQMGTPSLVAARQECEAQARRLIGDHAYQAAFHVGYDTDLDSGITYALSTPGTTPPQTPVN